jgi:hypothetical protein
MREICALAAFALPVVVATPALAETEEPGWAFLAGAVPALSGFIVGGLLLGRSDDVSAKNNAGWLAIQGGFVLAPLAAHAVAGEWGRGAAFSAIPAVAFAGSAAVFQIAPDAVAHGTLAEQRVIWSLFGVGLFASTVGIVDAVFASDRSRAVYLAPLVSPGSLAPGARTAGLAIGGVL